MTSYSVVIFLNWWTLFYGCFDYKSYGVDEIFSLARERHNILHTSAWEAHINSFLDVSNNCLLFVTTSINEPYVHVYDDDSLYLRAKLCIPDTSPEVSYDVEDALVLVVVTGTLGLIFIHAPIIWDDPWKTVLGINPHYKGTSLLMCESVHYKLDDQRIVSVLNCVDVACWRK